MSNSPKSEKFYEEQDEFRRNVGYGIAGSIGLGALGFAGWIATSRWHVCQPHEYLVRTGLGIKNMSISRQGIQWPFQRAQKISMHPRSYRFSLACLSKQYLPFDMPVNYTVRPKNPEIDLEGFKLYAENMEPLSEHAYEQTILAAIHGETRVQAAQMEIDRINDDRDEFRKTVVEVVQKKLDEVGVDVVNANIAELKENEREGQMGYLAARERKKLAEAVQQSEIDVAEATRDGDIGKKERERDTRMKTAAMEASAILTENENRQQIAKSQAELAVVEAEARRLSEISRVESEMAAKQREIELQKDVNIRDAEQELERRRAAELTESKVRAESLVASSEGQKKSIEMLADAELYRQEQNAKGIQAVFEAQANGLRSIYESCESNPDLTKFYLMKDILPQLAEQQAKAVQNLNPEIKVWNTGNSTENPMNSVTNVVQSMAPLLEGLATQGNVKMPDWLPKNKSDK